MKTRTQKKFHTRNLLLIICTISCLVCYDIFGGLWLKGLTSFWFVLLGFVNLCYARKVRPDNTRFLVLIELGLILGMCADVLLGVQFILGILSFSLGHVCYLIAFYTLEKPKLKDLLIIVPIAAVSMYIVSGTPFIQITDPVLKPMLLGYAVIIASMLGKAVSNLTVRKSTFRWLICIGSAMFWFSDVMLAIDMFGTPSRLTWMLCSYTYWPAQTILAYAMFHFIREQTQ